MKLLCLVFAAAVGWACSLEAHPVAQGAIELEAGANKIALRVRASPEEVFVANMHAQPPAASLADAYQQHGVYLLRHLRVVADGTELDGVLLRASAPDAAAGTAQAIYDFEYPVTAAPGSVKISQSVLNEFEYAPGNRWEASYVVRARMGGQIVLDGALFTSAAPLQISAAERPSAWRTAGDYLRHGITHILTGYDHLLFIAALALAVTTFWELFKIIGAFTLAHTITLTLSVFDIVRLPAQVVEPMIAASIVFVALQNVFWPGRSRGAGRLSVAFFFGLFHGLGFAGGLLEAMSGLPGASVGLAILAFSVGVEIGHQCVVLPLFGLTSLVRNWRRRASASVEPAGDWLLRGGSAVIAAAGMFYLIAALTQVGRPS